MNYIKKAILAVVAVCLMILLLPLASRAAVAPYFVAVNDKLLPFSEDTMPFISGGEVFVPYKVFSEAKIWSLTSGERVRLIQNPKWLDFKTDQEITMDQDGNTINCSPAIKVGKQFYLPLNQMCDFFNLSSEIKNIPRDIIPDEQMSVLRIWSNSIKVFNTESFMGVNRIALKSAYDKYYAPPVETSTPPPVSPTITPPTGNPGNPYPPYLPTVPPPPPPPPPPTYEDVTIYLSFYGIEPIIAQRVLDILNAPSAHGCASCFYFTAAEIARYPDLVRKISGSGHAVGIWMEAGSFEEYLEASALLFEAAKIKTVLVSSDETDITAIHTADLQGLIFWGASMSFDDDGDYDRDSMIAALPKERGEIFTIRFACTGETVSALPYLLSYLRENKYTLAKITETTMSAR